MASHIFRLLFRSLRLSLSGSFGLSTPFLLRIALKNSSASSFVVRDRSVSIAECRHETSINCLMVHKQVKSNMMDRKSIISTRRRTERIVRNDS